jgi:hypothetical protein
MYRDYETMEHKGHSFRVSFEHDADNGPPWENDDGRGIVSDWRKARDWRGNVSKAPGERVLCTDRYSARFFDFAGTVAKARRDGWGLSDSDMAQLRAKLGREPRKGDIAHACAEREFEFLWQWCNDGWQYVGVIVTLLDSAGEETGYTDSIWGVETFADYHQEVARELADNCLADRRRAIKDKAKETRERNYWAARDVVTRI